MSIGTSLGGFYQSEMEMSVDSFGMKDKMDKTPYEVEQDKAGNQSEVQNYGIDVSDKMPFPNNNNPDTDFTNRFGNLPPSGILNDLKKPSDTTPALVRRIAEVNKDPIGTNPKLSEFGGGGGGVSVPETVKSAALRIPSTGEVFEGANHGHAFGDIMDKYPNLDMNNFGKLGIQDGFTTSKGRFISREEAMSLAIRRNQLNENAAKTREMLPDTNDMLLSEDLK